MLSLPKRVWVYGGRFRWITGSGFRAYFSCFRGLERHLRDSLHPPEGGTPLGERSPPLPVATLPGLHGCLLHNPQQRGKEKCFSGQCIVTHQFRSHCSSGTTAWSQVGRCGNMVSREKTKLPAPPTSHLSSENGSCPQHAPMQPYSHK